MTAGAPKPTTPQKWFKLALIPVLSVVLLVLLWGQPKSKPAEPAVAGAVNASTATADSAAGNVPRPAARKWPKARLEDVIAFNPFEPEQDESMQVAGSGGVAKYPTGSRGDKTHSKLVSTGNLQAIFVDAQGAAAILDSEVIHVGDILPSGGRVVEITAQGIKLEGL